MTVSNDLRSRSVFLLSDPLENSKIVATELEKCYFSCRSIGCGTSRELKEKKVAFLVFRFLDEW